MHIPGIPGDVQAVAGRRLGATVDPCHQGMRLVPQAQDGLRAHVIDSDDLDRQTALGE